MKQLKLYITLLILSVVGTNSYTYAQDTIRQKEISGLVLEHGTSNTRIVDANVTNLRTRQSVRTSMQGVFTLLAQVGDSLSVEKTGYGPIKTAIRTLDDIILEMQPGLEIETVVVSRSTREEELRRTLSDYGKKGVYNGGHNTVGTYLASPATALYNLFGKEPKNARRFEEYMNKELEQTNVDRKFNRTLVAKLTKLEGDQLKSFMDMYRPSWSRVQNMGEYDLMMYINKSFAEWDKNGRPKPNRLPKLDIPKQEK